MNKSYLLIATTLVFSSSVFAGGTLGGNPPADSGAVNVGVGKCTQYKLDVKAAKQAGKNVNTVAVPKGCEAIKEK